MWSFNPSPLGSGNRYDSRGTHRRFLGAARHLTAVTNLRSVLNRCRRLRQVHANPACQQHHSAQPHYPVAAKIASLWDLPTRRAPSMATTTPWGGMLRTPIGTIACIDHNISERQRIYGRFDLTSLQPPENSRQSSTLGDPSIAPIEARPSIMSSSSRLHSWLSHAAASCASARATRRISRVGISHRSASQHPLFHNCSIRSTRAQISEHQCDFHRQHYLLAAGRCQHQ